MSIDTAILILRNRSLMFQRPSNFNDPFELHLGLMNLNFEEGHAVDIYQRYFNGGNPVSEKLRTYLETNGNELITRATREVFSQFRENVGITCFTKNPTNTLMWSHYGNSHKGICLGFVITGYNRVRDTFNVNYSATITPVKFFDEIQRDLIFWYWIFTKSHVWSYEQEVRCVNMFANGIQPFDDITVTEIYYGAGTTPESIEEIEAILGTHPITKRAKMEINPATFDLVETTLK